MNYIIKKWIEPYVLLETSKKHFKMQDFTFDGFSKNEIKNKFHSALVKENGTAFGLYMKNVNKFYLFSSEEKMNIEKDLLNNALGFSAEDYETTVDGELPVNLVDMGKAEAGIIQA